VGAGWRVFAFRCEKILRVFSLQHHSQVASIEFAGRDFSCSDVFDRFDGWDACDNVLRRTDFDARARMGADRLHCKSVAQRDIVTTLVQLLSWQLQARGIETKRMTKMNEP